MLKIYRHLPTYIFGFVGFLALFILFAVDFFNPTKTGIFVQMPLFSVVMMAFSGFVTCCLGHSIFKASQPVIVVHANTITLMRVDRPWRTAELSRSEIQAIHFEQPDVVPSYIVFSVSEETAKAQKKTGVFHYTKKGELFFECSNLNMNNPDIVAAVKEKMNL